MPGKHKSFEPSWRSIMLPLKDLWHPPEHSFAVYKSIPLVQRETRTNPPTLWLFNWSVSISSFAYQYLSQRSRAGGHREPNKEMFTACVIQNPFSLVDAGFFPLSLRIIAGWPIFTIPDLYNQLEKTAFNTPRGFWVSCNTSGRCFSPSGRRPLSRPWTCQRDCVSRLSSGCCWKW